MRKSAFETGEARWVLYISGTEERRLIIIMTIIRERDPLRNRRSRTRVTKAIEKAF
jgi:hypothetical protein